MKENGLKSALREGKVVIGNLMFTPCPELVEIMAEIGFDWVAIDLEHGSYGIDSARNCVLAADASGIVPLLRVRDNHPNFIEQALDLGAQGVIVPHINSREEALQAFQAQSTHR